MLYIFSLLETLFLLGDFTQIMLKLDYKFEYYSNALKTFSCKLIRRLS